MATKLIDAPEVVGKAPTHVKISPTLINRDHCDDAIYAYVRPFLGPELLALILADKKDFAGWEQQFPSYAIDALVFSPLDFKYYKRINLAGNSTPPLDAVNWVEVIPFANADYAGLWASGLWKLCSYGSLKQALPFIWRQITSGGIVNASGDQNTSITDQDLVVLEDRLSGKIRLSRAQCHDYICEKRVADETKFTEYIGKCKGCKNKEESGTTGVPQNFGVFMYPDCDQKCDDEC